MPEVSEHYRSRRPSPIRAMQILSMARPDLARLSIVNVAIGNVSLPIHPAMRERMGRLLDATAGSPFARGAVQYTPTVGLVETQRAFLSIIASAGCPIEGLECVVTDGGSMAMELMLLGVSGPGSSRPVLMLDPTYSNYADLARRIGARTIAVPRRLGEDGRYALPDAATLERVIAAERPTALLVIPADNPTGQHMTQDALETLAAIATAHDLWLVSDEAYRQLSYDGQAPSSIWRITDREVPGVRGRRASIESASKVWNACGLRVGALVSDNPELAARAVAEYTANLSSNAIGQWIFGAMAHVPPTELTAWYEAQRAHYREVMRSVTDALRAIVPRLIVSSPAAALYSVLDLRAIDPDFDAVGFARYCATEGAVDHLGKPHTLLLAPMTGFQGGEADPVTRTQLRLAYVESPEVMRKVAPLFAGLLDQYRKRPS